MAIRPTRRTSPRTRPQPIWLPPLGIRPLRRPLRNQRPPALRHPLPRNKAPLHLPLRNRAHLRRIRARIRIRTIRAMECSPLRMRHSRPPRCPSMISHRLPETAICGRPAIGRGRRQAITGCPAHGFRLPMRAPCGRPATGAGDTTATSSTGATGAGTSATTAASIMASATSASATRAATGITTISGTTAR